MKKIVDAHLPLTEQAFCLLRYLSAPFKEVEKLIPKKANILDIGCGHGLFDLVLAENSKQRIIVGIDPDSHKIKQAKKIAGSNRNLTFKNIFLEKFNSIKKFNCLILFDVDYLLDFDGKKKILKQAKKFITKNGIIIVKTVIKNQSMGYYAGYLQELVTVFLLKKTFTEKNFFNFLRVEEYRQLFKEAGFTIRQEKKLKTFFYHPHYVFVLKVKK